MCRKQPGIAIGRLCDKCDGKCPVCDSYVRPTTLVRICDECSFGNYQNKCVVCGGEVWVEPSMIFRRYTKQYLGNFWCFLLFWMHPSRKGSRWLPKDYKSWKLKDRPVLPTQTAANIKTLHCLRFRSRRFYGLYREMVCCKCFTAKSHTVFGSIATGLFLDLDLGKCGKVLHLLHKANVAARNLSNSRTRRFISCKVLLEYVRSSTISL